MHSERQVNSVARKRIVFVIVEGPSDDAALGVILNRLYDKSKVYIEIMHGDITTDLKIKPCDIVSALGNIVKNYAATMHFSQSHFQEVIHLVDMDGAFVPDTAIVENPDVNKPVYSLTEIQTSRPRQLLSRNRHKQRQLKRISTLKKVWVSIPYRAYYMSCNLDHVLYGMLNSSDDEKENDAYAFAKKYKDNIDEFLTFISDSGFSRMDGYKESWDFIKEDLHSLERYTNFGLCLVNIREERRREKKDQEMP